MAASDCSGFVIAILADAESFARAAIIAIRQTSSQPGNSSSWTCASISICESCLVSLALSLSEPSMRTGSGSPSGRTPAADSCLALRPSAPDDSILPLPPSPAPLSSPAMAPSLPVELALSLSVSLAACSSHPMLSLLSVSQGGLLLLSLVTRVVAERLDRIWASLSRASFLRVAGNFCWTAYSAVVRGSFDRFLAASWPCWRSERGCLAPSTLKPWPHSDRDGS